jgi:hypothetical protein
MEERGAIARCRKRPAKVSEAEVVRERPSRDDVRPTPRGPCARVTATLHIGIIGGVFQRGAFVVQDGALQDVRGSSEAF